MRSAAQVDEFTLAIEAELFVLGQAGLDMFDLERLFQVGAQLDRFIAGQRKLLERLGVFDDLGHLFFDGGKVIFAKLVVEFEIVIKTVIDGRAECQGNAVEDAHHGPRHDVRAGVSQNLQGFGIPLGEQGQRNR